MSEWKEASNTSEKLPMWNPCTYKDEDGEVVQKKPSEKSFIVGYYLGMEIFSGKDGKQITKHKLQFKKVGIKDDIELKDEVEFPEEGDVVELWGKTALDETLTKNIAEGQLVMITWNGRVKSKRNPSMKYHSFDVKYKDEFIEVKSKPAAPKEEKASKANDEDPFGDDDSEDDLAF